jgi:hypothetical protein
MLNIIRAVNSWIMRWTGLVARMAQTRNAIKMLSTKPEGKTKLGTVRHIWEENIRMELNDIRRDVFIRLRIGSTGGLL